MDHSFVFGGIDKGKCAKCKYDFIAHSDIATCEACSKIGKVSLFGDINNPKRMLLCADCSQKEIDTAISIANDPILQQSRLEQMLSQARLVDSGVKYNGDFFNSPTVPSETLRASIYDMDMTEQQKKETFNQFLSERIAHFRDSIFLTVKQIEQTDEYTRRGTYESLRDMASALHRAMREKLAAEDKNYVPLITKQVKPKVKKETLGTYDRLVQMFVLMHGCTKEEAIEAINKGSGGKLGNTKFEVAPKP